MKQFLVWAVLSAAWVMAAQENLPIASSNETLAQPSAEDIISVLRSKPELLPSVKEFVLQNAHRQGALLDTTDLTDEALFRMIREDLQLRQAISQKIQESSRLRTPAVSFADDETEANAIGSRSWDDEQGADAFARTRTESELSPRMQSEQQAPNLSSTPSDFQPGTPAIRATRKISGTRPSEDQNQPVTMRQPNPYPDLPSAQDLYRQIPNAGATLKRFGEDVFLNGTGNLDSLPMDLPAGPDYVLGPGDGLTITVWGSVSQKITVKIDREGQIALPESGTVMLAGRTLRDAEELVGRALSAEYKTARVNVSLTRLRTIRVYVVGDVQRPGAYDLSSLSTPLNALYAAGGPTNRGSLRSVRHYRGKQLVRDVDLYDLMLRGVSTNIAPMQPGDTILIPTAGPQVGVAGMVRRPAIYELTRENDLAEVIQLAGGVLVSATLRHVIVERIEAHQRRVTMSLDLPDADYRDNTALQKALGSFAVQDGDRVTISPILPYSDKTVYLQGHVFRPGKYPYRDGIQIADLIRSYQDLLPEPAQHAEIVRLAPPDFRPTIIQFNLDDVLGGDDPIDLQPFDTIRIFGRYEIDPPKVRIYGDVLRPGEYPMSAGMTSADLVRMAGGFRRSAFAFTGESLRLALGMRPQRHIVTCFEQPLRHRISHQTQSEKA